MLMRRRGEKKLYSVYLCYSVRITMYTRLVLSWYAAELYLYTHIHRVDILFSVSFTPGRVVVVFTESFPAIIHNSYAIRLLQSPRCYYTFGIFYPFLVRSSTFHFNPHIYSPPNSNTHAHDHSQITIILCIQ